MRRTGAVAGSAKPSARSTVRRLQHLARGIVVDLAQRPRQAGARSRQVGGAPLRALQRTAKLDSVRPCVFAPKVPFVHELAKFYVCLEVAATARSEAPLWL